MHNQLTQTYEDYRMGFLNVVIYLLLKQVKITRPFRNYKVSQTFIIPNYS